MVKKIKYVITIFLLLAALLSGCSSEENIKSIKYDGKIFIVNATENSITNNDDVYYYTFNKSEIEISYPNGGIFFQKTKGNITTSGSNSRYDEESYIAGDTLVTVINDAQPKKTLDLERFILVLVFLLLGLWNILSPYTAWYMSYGWRYKNAEPSHFALILARVSGVIALIVAIAMGVNGV